MANYSIKNFLPRPLPFKCHLVGAAPLSASSDLAASEPGLRGDALRTLTGTVSAKRSLWNLSSHLSLQSPRMKRVGKDAGSTFPAPHRDPRGSALPGTRAARLIYLFVGQNKAPGPGPRALHTRPWGSENKLGHPCTGDWGLGRMSLA